MKAAWVSMEEKERSEHGQRARGGNADGACGELQDFLARGRVGENSGERGARANQTGPPRPWSGVSILILKAARR